MLKNLQRAVAYGRNLGADWQPHAGGMLAIDPDTGPEACVAGLALLAEGIHLRPNTAVLPMIRPEPPHDTRFFTVHVPDTGEFRAFMAAIRAARADAVDIGEGHLAVVPPAKPAGAAVEFLKPQWAGIAHAMNEARVGNWDAAARALPDLHTERVMAELRAIARSPDALFDDHDSWGRFADWAEQGPIRLLETM